MLDDVMIPRPGTAVALLVAGFVATACDAGQAPQTSPSVSSMPEIVDVIRDLEYARPEVAGSGVSLRLDLYRPVVERVVPLVVFVHGGGWIEGSRDRCPGQAFAARGYAVACIDYRLGDAAGCPEGSVFPAQQAMGYGLDPERIGVMGDSSGGHLAALLGTSGDVAELAGSENPGPSDAVQAVVDWFGPVDIREGPVVFEDDPCVVDLAALDRAYGGEATPYFYWTRAWGLFLGGSLADPDVLARATAATPLTYVDAGDPPFLVIHGESDGLVPIRQSELLAGALESAGVAVTFVRLPGAGHAYGPPGRAGEVLPDFLEPTLDFLDHRLRTP